MSISWQKRDIQGCQTDRINKRGNQDLKEKKVCKNKGEKDQKPGTKFNQTKESVKLKYTEGKKGKKHQGEM